MSRLSLAKCRSLLKGVYSYTATGSTSNALQTRPYCQKSNDLDTKVTSQAFAGQNLFRPERRPSNIDKKILLWAGRFKKEADIPAYVSCETITAARNNVRIKICYAMIGMTILGCITMVILGKKALKEDNTLLQRNLERKAKWREETTKEQEVPSLKNH
ncbi:protein FAM162B [Bombina bombina]|uniref:protein FAM162B n=1 Tax=Bombina bombina TaxID=8345 RepID=UPI00235AF723|nr:protein FAM162B [Bombina bombina]